MPFLAVLEVASIEGLAQAAQRQETAQGAVIIRQGEPGDAQYLLESGQLEVSVLGRAERVLVGPGQGVGEITMLRRVPRSATVTAAQASVLWRLPRADILRTVTRSTSEPPADWEASGWLSNSRPLTPAPKNSPVTRADHQRDNVDD